MSEDAIGLETIFEAGPGGQYLDTLQTARTFRQEHWHPSLWSQTMVAAWLAGDRRLDVDKAREIVLDLYVHTPAAQGMSEGLEREVLRHFLVIPGLESSPAGRDAAAVGADDGGVAG